MSSCWASADDPLLLGYHDQEWGRPVLDDRGLFERISLEGFQSGLSWRTVLAKRDAFREVFEGFDPVAVAGFHAARVDQLMADARIIRNRRKIEAAVGNARALLELDTSLADLLRSHCPQPRPAPSSLAQVPSLQPESTALSKELRRRGFAFVGPTTVYATMQAVGIVNDHLADCAVREAVEAERVAAGLPASAS